MRQKGTGRAMDQEDWIKMIHLIDSAKIEYQN